MSHSNVVPITGHMRRQLVQRCQRWAAIYNLPMTADTAVLFVMATRASTQAKLTYAKAMSAISRYFQWEQRPLLTLISALRSAGAQIPTRQATPITKQVLLAWAARQSPDVQITAMVAWKTASRWTEAAALTRANFISVSDQEVVVDWRTIPKGRRANPFAESRWTVIVGSLTKNIAQRLRHLPAGPLTTLTASSLDRRWAATAAMASYTAHSIKRGALTVLLQMAAQGRLNLRYVGLVAKHTAAVPELAAVTIRYGADPIALARALGSSRATALL
jgi:integrase